MLQTIKETIENLHSSLSDYIEATYHISAPTLIRKRQELLKRDGVIHRIPYLESTPKYQTGDAFASMAGLPSAVQTLFSRLSFPEKDLPRLIYDPPFKHQAESLNHGLVNGKNLVIMTGTGSGKTEAFLLPILGKFAKEAQSRPEVFAQQAAMRALILYPMNALVNDQLGRLRALLGDPRLVETFKEWCGRPARFARYTSRTPYAGVRTSKKDSSRLKSFDNFYVDLLRRTESDDEDEKAQAFKLLNALKDRGKWPAKPDLMAWFGEKGGSWQNRKTDEFIRAATLKDDSELLTRHEVQAAPPDLLVTNYSMLEYMLIRPIERPIFDSTRDWLFDNPDENFLVVLDEAHLYRGAAGAEVGLLLRRLRDRLDVPVERFKVICATASFQDAEYAPDFGAQLSGVPEETFVPIKGTLNLYDGAGVGSRADAEVLSSIDLEAFYETDRDEARQALVKRLLDYRSVTGTGTAERGLFDALKSFPPMCMLINETMKEARPIAELGRFLFAKGVPSHMADKAFTVLMALGSAARPDPELPGLLPCRVHNFFRGLPGLWVCMDPDCSELAEDLSDDICGKIYSQPIDECGCGSRVLELYTCRNCGTAYARAYTDNVDSPRALWSEPGEPLRMSDTETSPLFAIDLLLEQPVDDNLAEPADYDLETGQLNPDCTGPRMRTVYIRQNRLTDATHNNGESKNNHDSRGEFKPCAVCGKTASFGRSYVQDHQTKGDQPFQTLIARQIQIQPPGPQKATPFAPLRGRKVLAFSDSRQVAARLAPNVQMYSERDTLRPQIVCGFKWLEEQDAIRSLLSLNDLYFAVLLASKHLKVRLRPEMRENENFYAEEIVNSALCEGALDDPSTLFNLLIKIRQQRPPESLLNSMLMALTDRFWGMEPLALATLKERDCHSEKILNLPPIPGLVEVDEAKLAFARYWLRCWNNNGFWLAQMPTNWINRPTSEGFRVRPRNPKSKIKAIESLIHEKTAGKIFRDSWLPELLTCFTLSAEKGFRYLDGEELSLQFDGDWVHCARCKSVHRPFPGIERCLNCKSDTVSPLDPNSDPVFLARKGFYRKPVMEALEDPPRQPMALIAAEHTAQLNAPQNEDVFSKAEEHELLFQDIELTGSGIGGRSPAIDVLSSTTTMEVGIDLGALSGVALRNMPPGRANYQQRAGRAGRRGNTVATVIAFGSADSHDEHYFTHPDIMIRGEVVDPKLTLDNPEIVRRHIRAFILQNYHQDCLPVIDPNQPHDLFSVLGSVSDFRKAESLLNRHDLAVWLIKNECVLRKRIASWIPTQLLTEDRDELLKSFVDDCRQAVEEAIAFDSSTDEEYRISDDDSGVIEAAAETGEERPQQASNPSKMLDRLLYCGKLPRYAFPTDVATFHVFDQNKSSRYRHVMKFAPSQGLPVALSQYAPDKQVWISGKCYRSGAIYSFMKDERFNAWKSKRLYMECKDCGFAQLFNEGEVDRNYTSNCKACGGEDTFGPARYWMRPPGFAHPIGEDEMTSPDDITETSFATRAKLTLVAPTDDGGWTKVNERIRGWKTRCHLLVSNTGPKHMGYNYCVKCGRIEASNAPEPILVEPHLKPFPADDYGRMCDGNRTALHLVLGADFISDIALFSMSVIAPIELKPGLYSTNVALRTVGEALAKAACQLLEIEPGELMAEYRPALTPSGKSGLEAEIFLYDTLPGGAGFASQFANRGLELFEHAYQLLKSCPENCNASCYRCLRSFKNKFEHKLLDRHVGAELLEYLLTGQPPSFNAERLKNSTTLLLNDLRRCDNEEVAFKSNAEIKYGDGKSVDVPIFAEYKGQKFVIALSGPLTTGHPADPAIVALRDCDPAYKVIVENELIVRGNLPAATKKIYQQITV